MCVIYNVIIEHEWLGAHWIWMSLMVKTSLK